MRSPQAWIKRRARKLMAAFGAKRAKAVRYASEDWKAFAGTSTRTCAELGVCQSRPECTRCSVPVEARMASMEKRDFRRFMTKVKGEVA
ncbi:hypothetical protein [Variovorax sp. E3]|uniref:hypothetical protein n=1 Tax=Variovorax sp. E3 TaxID=1914993 RepID=UPI0018DCEDEB|nr:hypothetical protein [Variovorax sp. E3]